MHNDMKKFLSTLFVLLFAFVVMAQTGLTCDDPIPVDENYRGRVEGPCEVWYTAYTYDLPLTVYFSPDAADSDWGPEVVVDFTCTPGEYEDPELANVIATVTDLGFELPVEFLCDRVFRNGKYAYDLSIGKFYRDQLLECGITHNVQAFVKVTFFEPGEISLRPDTLFKNCIENSHYIKLNDTIDILPNDSDRVFIVPFPDWKNDSTRIVWDGEEPAQIWLATSTCNFEPKQENVFVYTTYQTSKDAPYKLYKDQMENDIEKSTDGGLFYAKILSPTAGRLVVEKIPMSDANGGATIFAYDQPVQVAANDSISLFAIPKTWKKATQFVIEGASNVKMQMSNNFLFETTNLKMFVNEYIAQSFGDDLAVSFTSSEFTPLTNRVLDTDNYLYVRFVSSEAFTVTPKLWDISECIDNTKILLPNVKVTIAKGGGTIYRINYAELQGCEMTIKWDGSSRMYTYIGDTCSFAMSSTNSHVIHYENFSRKGTRLVDAATIMSWRDYADEDGYIYARFNPSSSGPLTLVTTKLELDPIYTTITESVCFGESYTWNGQTYATTGEYQQTFVAANGADSIVTLQLTVRPEVPATEEHVTVAYSETHTWNGVTYTESGSYSATLQDAFGCDSVVTLHLTVLPNPDRTELYPNDYMILNLASAFKVFTMEHLSWVAQDVNIHWGGTSPLYVFIASENDFALTPYNRYVLHYEEIAASGDWVLTAAQMASWAQHAAAAGGKVYVRFLTEFEGELTTKGL